jgi:hypothetical protein
MSEWREKWHRVPKGARIISMVVIGLVTAAILGLVFGIFVRELWNLIMPELFGLKTITYWQAFGIVILGHLIFGGSGGGHSESKSSRRRKYHDSCGEYDDSKESLKHWMYYDEWWSSQGNKAFTDYVEKKDQANKRPNENQ